MKTIYVVVFIALLLPVTLSAQIIPLNRRVDWTFAGLQNPLPNYPNVVDITNYGGIGNGVFPNDAALQLAIQSLGVDSGVIYFPPGNYAFLSPIFLRSGLVLRGQSATETTLQFNLFGTDDLIYVLGNNTSTINALAQAADKGSDKIIVTNASAFAIGDYVKLFQNDSSLVLDVFHCVGQMLNIKNIVGDTITFASPLRRSYAMIDSPQIRKVSMITGAGIECLKIKRLDSGFQKTNITFSYAAKCWVKGVESDSTNFAHISINSSTNIEISGCYFHGAFDYGPGGQGYGISLNTTTGECLIENNIFRHLRHAMLVQSGANGNVFALNYSRETFKSESQPNELSGDIVLHGNYPYANLFEGNIVQNIVVDLSHYINGPFNTFFRNRAELYGILFSTGSGDSSNIVGNEITSLFTGQYIIAGNGHFAYGNNRFGNILPAGTTNLTDSSYYYSNEPYFWHFARPFPSIGIPNTINSGSIPALSHYLADTNLTECPNNKVLALDKIFLTIKFAGNKIRLNWDINDNDGTKLFEIERSVDGINFLKLDSQYPGSGISQYTYTDKAPTSGLVFYRIRKILQTGKIIYSNITGINTSDNFIKVFPNPAIDKIEILLNRKYRDYTINIKNVLGQVVRNQKGAGNLLNPVSINVSKLQPGMYFLEINDGITREKIVRQIIKK